MIVVGEFFGIGLGVVDVIRGDGIKVELVSFSSVFVLVILFSFFIVLFLRFRLFRDVGLFLLVVFLFFILFFSFWL